MKNVLSGRQGRQLMRAAGRPANALRTLSGHRTSLGPLDRRPVAADNASRTQSVVAHPLGPSNGAAQEYCSLSEQCLPLWGRWPSVSEVGRGSCEFAETLKKGFYVTALFRPPAGHLPQRGRLWCDKFPFTFLSTSGRGAQRMGDDRPAFVTYCPRRLAAILFPQIIWGWRRWSVPPPLPLSRWWGRCRSGRGFFPEPWS